MGWYPRRDAISLSTAPPVAVAYTATAGSAVAASKDDHVHPISLTSATNYLAGDVTMTNANQYYDGPSVSLGEGVWLVFGSLCFRAASGAGGDNIHARLWDGTNVYAEAESRIYVNTGRQSVAAMAPITLGSATTIKLSGASANAGNVIDSQLIANGTADRATWIFAVRVG